LSSLLCAAALFGLAHTARQSSMTGAYCAFTCALLAWGWNELSFLTGWITGPRTTALPKGASGWFRFVESLRAVLWHELAILVVGVAILVMTWDAPNQVGTGTYLVLWVMRTSAKLNLFFGVRNLSEAFLPAHLAYLESFFRRRPMNAFFPFSVAAASVVLMMLVNFASSPFTSPAQVVGATLVCTLLALAIVEHLMLVLPLDTTALWRWAIRKRQGTGADDPFETKGPASNMEKHDNLLQIR
ncbi:MAG: putative photosynthetic complex assembly protein PuhE, partial [Burkholderiales bacterium]|nr:putative photosynthetic complex assembly protein PuhE [Burkholderiales bacterium]